MELKYSYNDEISLDGESYLVEAEYTAYSVSYVYGADADGNRGVDRQHLEIDFISLNITNEEGKVVRGDDVVFEKVKEKLVNEIREEYYG